MPDPLDIAALWEAQDAHDAGRLARWGFTTTSAGKTPDGDPAQEAEHDEDHDNGGAQ